MTSYFAGDTPMTTPIYLSRDPVHALNFTARKRDICYTAPCVDARGIDIQTKRERIERELRWTDNVGRGNAHIFRILCCYYCGWKFRCISADDLKRNCNVLQLWVEITEYLLNRSAVNASTNTSKNWNNMSKEKCCKSTFCTQEVLYLYDFSYNV